MIVKRFYDEKLAQASYMIGCPAAGEAIVIDPSRNIDQYLEAAKKERLKITAVTETHIHADFLSGIRELSNRTGARMYLSDEGDIDWKYGFSNEPLVTLVRDGDTIRVGPARLDVMATPGHTPEHIAFILTDEATSEVPLGAFTGDFVFVGDVGRPDLLERAANIKGTMVIGAKQQYESVQKLKPFKDGMIIWPGHGSGSACGKSLGGVPVSSLGYERVSNWALKSTDSDAFVDEILKGQPEPPTYFAMMKKLNKEGPAVLGEVAKPARQSAESLTDVLSGENTVVDIRDSGKVMAGLLPGSVHIAMAKGFTNWAGWLVPYDKPIYFLAESEQQVSQAVRDLVTIGLDDVRGWYGPEEIQSYASNNGELMTVEQTRASEMADMAASGNTVILDVRSATEREEGFVPGSLHIPLGYLESRLDELPKGKRVIVHCAGGVRSCTAASILKNNGFQDVCNLTGGFDEYVEAGLRVQEPALA
ncbi:MAG: MBL fold metallo-hydrolase [Armatimonadetes bacterium]|nr:MBL fold metallo-hydrolase [Armatimonadota bacterium]